MKNFEWTVTAEWREETSGLSPKLYQFTNRSESKPKKAEPKDEKSSDELFADALQLATVAAAAFGAWRAAK